MTQPKLANGTSLFCVITVPFLTLISQYDAVTNFIYFVIVAS